MVVMTIRIPAADRATNTHLLRHRMRTMSNRLTAAFRPMNKTVSTIPSSHCCERRKRARRTPGNADRALLSLTGQGGTISSYYQNVLNDVPGRFLVAFGNPYADGTQYCEYDIDCLNDGNQFCGDDLCPDGEQDRKLRKRHFYMLESGMPIVSPRELQPGTQVHRVLKRSEAEMTLRARGAGDPFELVGDAVSHGVDRL